ncbi:30S ribosomal protein S2 [Candidatus Absconditicoccus praedator]|uniref:30S ribosomal protein S2 n=1 Tax=Candidatus Absconditicoccus praedator TaxID=2735562 RepID=UPI001E35E4CB|nr:30S ribosomal protein S2 [Candidatus Absconditicoccus praedator]UFX82536.1 30S ribosomal protein S2 [Candidatus Absconditicoccus praedator]
MAANTDQIVENKLYVGGLKKFSNPKTMKYWADVVDNVVLFNPEFVSQQLENARKKVQEVKNAGGEVLIIMDKQLYKDDLESLCEEQGVHYFNYKVPAGVFTNFETLKSRIKQMNELKDFIQSDDFSALTKKEKSSTQKKLKKLESIYKGVKNLKALPSLVIIVDGVYLSNFVNEVERLGLDNIIVTNSEFNRYRDEERLLMTNTNSYKSLDFVLKYILK